VARPDGTHQVHVHMAEPFLLNRNGLQGSYRLLVNLATLALLAIPAPTGHILHRNRVVSSLCVARTPGCATPWTALETGTWSTTGTKGCVLPHDMWQRRG
jgi:hypothetical protein